MDQNTKIIVKTIAVEYERKFNLGDYNSMSVKATAWADLEEGQDEKDAYAALFKEVRGVVQEQSAPVLAGYGVKRPAVDLTETFAGKPLAKVANNGH